MNKSIEAYDIRARVARYDADMDLMHPNRHKMVDVSLEILPFPSTQPITVLDLGVGTGYFAMRVLRHYPDARLTGLDGSAVMIELAETRLSEFVEVGRVRFVRSSFQDLASALPHSDQFDLVFSSYSLHHLNEVEKRKVAHEAAQRLKPGGWFINADLVSHQFPEIEHVIQDARVAGIHERSDGKDERFATPDAVRTFLNSLEATEGDQPLSSEEDLEILRECGIDNATVFWKEYREMVCGGSI